MRKSGRFSIIILGLSLMTISMSSAGEPVGIGVAWFEKSGGATRVAKGFYQRTRELAPDAKVEYQKELASPDELAKVVDRWEKTKKGMVILRSAGAKWLIRNPPKIPAFIGGCNHPKLLGVIKNPMAPEGNITGVTYYLPAETQFEIFKAILPDFESLVLLFDPGHPSTSIDRERTKTACGNMGIRYYEESCLSAKDVFTAVGRFRGKVSAILLGNIKLVTDNAAAIVNAAKNTPVLSYPFESVESGALGGFLADDVKLGQMLAESVIDVLVKGKAVREVPVKTDPDPIFAVNVRTAERIGIEIPFHILKKARIIE